MRIPTAAATLAGWLALAACSDPSLSIELRNDDAALRDRLTSLTAVVVELPPHPDGSPVMCDEVRFGRVSADQLDGGRRASASAGAVLTGVPRLGAKLVILEGRDRTGARIAGGCEELGDIENDLTLPIDVELAPQVRLALGLNGVRDASSPPADFVVGVGRPWREDAGVVGVGGVDLEIDLRDRVADRERLVTVTSCGAPGPDCAVDALPGYAPVPLAREIGELPAPLAPGPVEVIVRGPWMEEPLFVRAFEPLTALMRDEVDLAPPAMPRAENLAAPSWVFTREGEDVRAAALFVSGEPRTYRVIVVDSVGDPPRLRRRELVMPEPVMALMPWLGAAWTRTASGWIRIDLATATAAEPVGGAGEPAAELVAIGPCVAGEPAGVLVRTVAGAGPYVPYAGPAGARVDSGELAAFTATVNRISPGRVVGDVCLSYPGGVKRTAIVRGELGGAPLATYLVPMGGGGLILSSPIVSGFVEYRAGVRRLAGAVLDVTGPRLASYGLTATQFTEDDQLEGDLVTLPSATSLGDLDGDGVIDMVATAHAIVDQSRVQITYLPDDGRAPLTGLTTPFAGTAPLVAVERLRTGRTLSAVVATSAQLAVFDLESEQP